MGIQLLGRHLADELNLLTRNEISAIKTNHSIQPILTVMTTGASNPQKISEVYLHEAVARQLGIEVRKIILDESIEENALIDIINQQNNDDQVYGILLLMPLPGHINQKHVLSCISLAKELEGLNEIKNMDNLFEGKQISTISSLFSLLKSVNHDFLSGRNILLMQDHILETNGIVKRLLEIISKLPISMEIIKSSSTNIKERTKQADVLLLSLESPESIDQDYLKEGAIVIDFNPIMVDTQYSDEKKRILPILTSCLNMESVLAKASYVAPCLGGVGPVLLAHLMRNFLFNLQMN